MSPTGIALLLTPLALALLGGAGWLWSKTGLAVWLETSQIWCG